MIFSRNNPVAKSTASLIMKQQIDDSQQYSSVKQLKSKTSFLELKETKFDNTSSDNNSPKGSPN